MPTTPPRFQSSVAPSACLYHASAAGASGTASIMEIKGWRLDITITSADYGACCNRLVLSATASLTSRPLARPPKPSCRLPASSLRPCLPWALSVSGFLLSRHWQDQQHTPSRKRLGGAAEIACAANTTEYPRSRPSVITTLAIRTSALFHRRQNWHVGERPLKKTFAHDH